MNRVHLMRRWFDSNDHFACFLGVPTHTVYEWMSGRREPSSAAMRLLDVMERLEGTDLHEVLIAQARPAPRPPRKPRPRRVRGVNAYSDPTIPAAVPRSLGPAVQPGPLHLSWDDDYWYPRTVTRADWAGDVPPAVTDQPELLGRYTDEQEAAYWASLKDYEDRTGRTMPE